MSKEIHAVRGMQDLYGSELVRWRHSESQIRTILENFGYQEIRTPALEKIEVFSQTVGDETDIVQKQMYTVNEGTDKLVLRPEGTAAFIRAVVEHGLHQSGHPERYYYYLPMFRHERPQKGRLRQFFQFGAELINDPSPEADAEIIASFDHVCRSLGIDKFDIRVNSVGCGNCRPLYKEALKNFFKPKLSELCEQCKARFERAPMRILDCKVETCKQIAAAAPVITSSLCTECHTHHDRLKKCLSLAKVTFIEDPKIVRGLDYYVRTAFEFVSGNLGAQDAIGGGGRYDGISQRFGNKPFPGVGYACGMERLMILLEGTPLPEMVKPMFYLAPLGSGAFDILFERNLHLKRSILTEMSYEKDKALKWHMKQANKSGAVYCLILGDDELKKGVFILKSMADGNQEELPLPELEHILISRGKK